MFRRVALFTGVALIGVLGIFFAIARPGCTCAPPAHPENNVVLAIVDIPGGTTITPDMLAIQEIPPAEHGPGVLQHFEDVIGKKAGSLIKAGSQIGTATVGGVAPLPTSSP